MFQSQGSKILQFQFHKGKLPELSSHHMSVCPTGNPQRTVFGIQSFQLYNNKTRKYIYIFIKASMQQDWVQGFENNIVLDAI